MHDFTSHSDYKRKGKILNKEMNEKKKEEENKEEEKKEGEKKGVKKIGFLDKMRDFITRSDKTNIGLINNNI
jgi:hypothetical protein